MLRFIKDVPEPREGDLAYNDDIKLHHYRGGKWNEILPESKESKEKREKELSDKKQMYDSGVRNYFSRGGIRMTLRPDGTEYIDKRDMPA